mmetsp:Transcript_4428/g.6065  ORF Transcript_4428/g.6065 Transcript_4428/m.6065 type:complete len:300 (-) Transcript_4428:162-1061(-)
MLSRTQGNVRILAATNLNIRNADLSVLEKIKVRGLFSLLLHDFSLFEEREHHGTSEVVDQVGIEAFDKVDFEESFLGVFVSLDDVVGPDDAECVLVDAPEVAGGGGHACRCSGAVVHESELPKAGACVGGACVAAVHAECDGAAGDDVEEVAHVSLLDDGGAALHRGLPHGLHERGALHLRHAGKHKVVLERAPEEGHLLLCFVVRFHRALADADQRGGEDVAHLYADVLLVSLRCLAFYAVAFQHLAGAFRQFFRHVRHAARYRGHRTGRRVRRLAQEVAYAHQVVFHHAEHHLAFLL